LKVDPDPCFTSLGGIFNAALVVREVFDPVQEQRL